jgi:hypothetical protein
MRPWFVGRKVLATIRVTKECSGRVLGEAEIDSIERDDEILGVINLFKCADDSRLAKESA